MAEGTGSGTLEQLDREFARSRRRAARRRALAQRPSTRSLGVRMGLLAVAGAALVGGIAAQDESPGGTRPRPTAGVSEAQARCPIPKAFRRAFVAAARESRLQVSLLVAVAEEESEMNPNARSRKGAIGLLQLMPSTAAELEVNATVPRENIRAGARYLRGLLTRFGGDVDLALAAYNAGPAAVARAGGPPSLETAAYVANVRARAAWHANCRG